MTPDYSGIKQNKIMTDDEIKEFDSVYVRDANFYEPAPEIRTKWLVPYVETTAENIKDFINSLLKKRAMQCEHCKKLHEDN